MKKLTKSTGTDPGSAELLAADGTLHAIRWSTGQIRDADGRESGIVAIGQEITGRPQA